MIKKLITVGAAGALLFASAMPVLAGNVLGGGGGRPNNNNGGVTQTNNGSLNNSVNVSSNTGGNLSSNTGGTLTLGRNKDKGKLSSGVQTGEAETQALVSTAANTNVAVVDCQCSGKVSQTNNGSVNNGVNVSSNSGFNVGNSVTTGISYTSAAVVTVANTNVAVGK